MVIARTEAPLNEEAHNRGATTPQLRAAEIDHVHELNRLVIRAVTALGDTGDAELACHIAAEAWAEQPGRFGWDYVESGPKVWRVRITRKKAA